MQNRYKQLSIEEVEARFAGKPGSYLQRKKKQANAILRAPYRKGLNYLRLMDIVQACADELFSQSFSRAVN